MATSYLRISGDHLADHLIYLSSLSSFWFSLNSSYDNKFHLSEQLDTSQPAGCCIASLRPLVVPLSCPVPSIAIARPLPAAIALCTATTATAAAKLLPPLHCCAAATATAATAAAPLPSCRQHCAVALLSPPPPLTLLRRYQAAANVKLLSCCNLH